MKVVLQDALNGMKTRTAWLAMLGFLLFNLSQVSAQNCTPIVVDVVQPSCTTSNDGAINVTPKPCGNQEVCYTGTPIPQIDCNSCSQSYTGSNLNVTVSAGQKVCITGNSSVQSLTLDGGTLVVCGTVSFSNWINFPSNKSVTMIVLGSATVQWGINLSSTGSKILNYGSLKLNGSGLSMDGEIVNYGDMELGGDLNINSGIAKFDNYKNLKVKNSLNSGETLNNWGTINIGTTGAGSKLQLNSSSRTLNACTINVNGDALFDAASVFDHRGKLTISKDTYINGNSVIQMMGGTRIQTKGNMIANSGVIGRVGGIGCSLFETLGRSTFNSGSHIRGNIAYCARGGISSNPPIEEGAVISCTSCSPPTDPPRETVAIAWTGPGGSSFNGSQINNLAPGNYQMNLSCGDCSYNQTYTITAPPALSVSVTLSEDQKSATASATGGVAPYMYQWTGPLSGTGATFNNIVPGIYTITVIDSKNCQATTTLEISATNCHPVVNQTPISCFGANDGKISIVNAGCANAQILWLELGSTSPTVSNLGPGTYRVHITCTDVCSEVISYTLTEPQALSILITTNANGSKTLSGQGGVGSYTYGWYLGDILLSSNITSEGLPSGTYQARVTDSKGCIASDTVIITNGDQGCSPDVRVSHITCQILNGKIEVNPSSICESAVIAWTNNTGHVVGTGTTLFASAGEYTLTLLCEDCAFSQQYTINAVPPLTVSAQASGITANTFVTGGTMPFMYQWIFEGRIVSTDSSPEVLPGGDNLLIVTDANGCSAETNVFVNTPACNPVATITPVTCPGAEDGSIVITSPGCESQAPSCGNIPDAPTPDQLCDCSQIITGTVNAVNVSNEKICIGDANITNLTLTGSGMIVFCGQADISRLEIRSGASGKLIVHNGLTISTAYFNSTTSKLYNYGTITVSNNALTLKGEVYNNNELQVFNDFTFSGSKFINKGRLKNHPVANTFNVYGRMENFGEIMVTGTSNISKVKVSGTSAYLVNHCTVQSAGGILIDQKGTLENKGSISGLDGATSVTIQNNSIVKLFSGSELRTSSLTIAKSNITHEGSGCSRISVEGTVRITSGTLNGSISLCDATPGQAGDATPSSGFKNGAGSNCNCAAQESTNGIEYTWYGINAQGATATNLAQGTYTVGVYCEGSCYSLESYEISGPPILSAVASVNDLGQVTTTVSGGTPFSSNEPYTYVWTSDNGISIPSVLNPTLPIPGYYILTVTDSRNCSVTTSVTWKTPPCSNMPIVTIKPSSCGSAGDGKITVVNTQCSSGDEVKYFWTGPGITEANNQSDSPDRLVAGTYTLTMTCGASCTSTFEYTIPSVNAINIKSISVTKELSCNQAFNGALSVEVNGGSGVYDYQWSDSWKNIGTNSPNISDLTAGVYYVTVTDKNGENGCMGKGSILLDEPGEDCELCTNAEIVKKDLTCASVPDGSLEVRMKDSGTYIYKWSTNQTTPKITGLDAGIYGVLITHTFNGDQCYMRQFIQEPEDFAVDIKMDGGPEICPGEVIRLEAVSASPVNFTWSPSNPQGINDPVFMAFQANTYTVTATWGSCSKTASVTLVSAPVNQCTNCGIAANVTTTPLTCYMSADGKAEVLATGGNGNYTYIWNNGATGRILNNVVAGAYLVSISETSGESPCSINKTVTIEQPPAMQIMIEGNSVVCNSSTTLLSAIGSPGVYTWTKIGTNDKFPNTQSISVALGGSYQVEVRSENGLCTARSQDFNLKQQEVPTIARSKSKLCPGETIELTASQSEDINWSTGETTQKITVSEPGTYTVSVKPVNCQTTSESITVTLKSPEECEDPNLCEPQFSIPLVLENPCVQETINRAEQRARERWQEYIDIQRKDFQRQYIAQCIQTQEELTMKYNEQEHHYTLFYYDQAGNLIRTVPPKGVKLITDQATLDKVKQERTSGSRTVETAHSYMTTYQFNSNNQSTGLIMPDHKPMVNNPKISQRQWYDELGRIALSQTSYHNAQNPKRYQYVIYDKLGREVENGEVRSNVDIATIQKPGFTSKVETQKLTDWLSTLRKYEVHRNYYDSLTFVIPEFDQQNLRNRLASATYEVDDADNNPLTYDNALHYSYDVHGNVREQITDYPELEHLLSRYKSLVYVYDLVSQNILEMQYQKGHLDQYFYRNEYDADNRLVQVWTSRDYIHWDRDAKQFFYDHGPLARTEIGHEKVQGVDYAYTIQGWIKGMNSNTLSSDRDMGHDGLAGTLHRNIPNDEMGYSLGFFKGDYSAIGNNNFLMNTSGSELETANKDLYNGNISNLITSISEFMKNGQGPLAQTFKYDQLNRLKESRAFEDANSVSNNSWSASGTATQKYMTRYTYDANGNILTLKRNAHVGTTPEGDGLDDLIYQYENNTNKLISVEEQRDNSNNPELEELDDIKPR